MLYGVSARITKNFEARMTKSAYHEARQVPASVNAGMPQEPRALMGRVLANCSVQNRTHTVVLLSAQHVGRFARDSRGATVQVATLEQCPMMISKTGQRRKGQKATKSAMTGPSLNSGRKHMGELEPCAGTSSESSVLQTSWTLAESCLKHCRPN